MNSTTAPGWLDIAEPWGTTLVDEWNLTTGKRLLSPLLDFVAGWHVPASEPSRVPRTQEQLRQVKEWTSWSSRTLAQATGTTHPTVEAVLRGRSQLVRVPGFAHRIMILHMLVSRLWTVVDGDRIELTRALSGHPGGNRPSALEMLEADDVPGSYLAALDVLAPPRTNGMMRGRFPRRPGEASVPLHEE
ncbi:MAG: hypothetical protein ACYDD0_04045 [Candidatus Dormibacteria bacterium]